MYVLSLVLLSCFTFPQHFNSLPLKGSFLVFSNTVQVLVLTYLSPPFLKFHSFCDLYLNSQIPVSLPLIQLFSLVLPIQQAALAQWLTEHSVHVGTQYFPLIAFQL